MATETELNNLKKLSTSDILRQDLSERIELEKEEILTGLMDLAKGVYMLEDSLDEKLRPIKKRKYLRYPDKDVAQYLLNQFIGKPKQNVEVSGDPEKPLIVQVAPEIASKYGLIKPSEDAAPSSEDHSS